MTWTSFDVCTTTLSLAPIVPHICLVRVMYLVISTAVRVILEVYAISFQSCRTLTVRLNHLHWSFTM